MRHVIFFFGSGLAWYVGLALLLLPALIPAAWKTRRKQQILTVGAVVGAVLLILSGTPQPWWLIGGSLAALLVIAVGASWRPQSKFAKARRGLTVCVCVGLAAIELPWTWSPGPMPIPSEPWCPRDQRMYQIRGFLPVLATHFSRPR